MGNSLSPATKIISELRRRRVFRTAALYVVGAWLVMQVADVTFPALDIPERALRYVLFAALAGFPAALVFGWFYDIGPGGIRRTPKAGPAELAESEPLRRVDYLLLTALAAVVAAILYNAVGGVVETPPDRVSERPAERSGPPVVAVLPFTTASLEGEGEFFATGVHDDLLTQLSKLQSIRVISRTSVLEYKGTTRNLRDIGSELGADVIMEGGVQVAGGQIRINAQLIDTRSDEHLWAETYDRDLSATSIFEVQNDIARAITEAMNATLTEQDKDQLSAIPTDNLAAYRAYRHAMDIRSGHGNEEFDVINAFKEAVDKDPRFVRAWAELVGAYSLRSNAPGRANLVAEAESALAKVRELAPGSAEEFIAQSYYLYYVIKDYDLARETLQKAIALNPSDTELLQVRGWIERRQGDFAARTETLQTLIQLDPRNLHYHGPLFINYVVTHEYDQALAALASIEHPSPLFEAYREMIGFKDHRDLVRLRENILALEDSLVEKFTFFIWIAHVLNRDFDSALAVLDRMDQEAATVPGALSSHEYFLLQTGWLMNQPDLYGELIPGLRARMEDTREEDGEISASWVLKNYALIEAISGNREATLAYVRAWEQAAEDDWAVRIGDRSDICTSLGMAGAAKAAVACIRTGLREPSYVMPFMEPYIPMYDPVRESPEWKALMAELESAGGN